MTMWDLRGLLDLDEHTAEVEDRIERITQGIEEAKTLEDIQQVYKQESGDLHFKMAEYRRRTRVLELATLVVFGILMVFSHGLFSLFIYDTSGVIKTLAVLYLIVAVAGYFVLRALYPDVDMIHQLIEMTKRKWLSIKYDVLFDELSPEFSQSLLLQGGSAFLGENSSLSDNQGLMNLSKAVFSKGNHTNELEACISGVVKSDRVYCPYLIYSYKYIIEKAKTDRNGNTRYEYTTHMEQGAVLTGFKIYDIDIHKSKRRWKSAYFKHVYDSSDIEFNKSFVVSGKDERELNLFMQPRVVVGIKKLFDQANLVRLTFGGYGEAIVPLNVDAFALHNDFSNKQVKVVSDVLPCLEKLDSLMLASWSDTLEEGLAVFKQEV